MTKKDVKVKEENVDKKIELPKEIQKDIENAKEWFEDVLFILGELYAEIGDIVDRDSIFRHFMKIIGNPITPILKPLELTSDLLELLYRDLTKNEKFLESLEAKIDARERAEHLPTPQAYKIKRLERSLRILRSKIKKDILFRGYELLNDLIVDLKQSFEKDIEFFKVYYDKFKHVIHLWIDLLIELSRVYGLIEQISLFSSKYKKFLDKIKETIESSNKNIAKKYGVDLVYIMKEFRDINIKEDELDIIIRQILIEGQFMDIKRTKAALDLIANIVKSIADNVGEFTPPLHKRKKEVGEL